MFVCLFFFYLLLPCLFVNCEHISHLVVVFLLFTLNMQCRLGQLIVWTPIIWASHDPKPWNLASTNWTCGDRGPWRKSLMPIVAIICQFCYWKWSSSSNLLIASSEPISFVSTSVADVSLLCSLVLVKSR